MKNIKSVNRLFRFMSAFEIDRFMILEVSDNSILAKVGWPNVDSLEDYNAEEETQVIKWIIQSFDHIDDSLAALEIVADMGKFKMDLLDLDRNELASILGRQKGWDKVYSESVIDGLLKISVDMIDNGKKTDRFFVHF